MIDLRIRRAFASFLDRTRPATALLALSGLFCTAQAQPAYQSLSLIHI